MRTADQINLPQCGIGWFKPTGPVPKPIITGKQIVWGIPKEIKPISNRPPGSMRLAFGDREEGRAYFTTPEGIRCFVIEVVDGEWIINPNLEQRIKK